MYQVPLRFINVSDNVVVCATRITAIMSTDLHQARETLKAERKSNTLINACGADKALSAVFLDNGAVVASSYSVNKLIRLIGKENNKESATISKAKKTKINTYELSIDNSENESEEENNDCED